jgi:hypothetical protein
MHFDLIPFPYLPFRTPGPQRDSIKAMDPESLLLQMQEGGDRRTTYQLMDPFNLLTTQFMKEAMSLVRIVQAFTLSPSLDTKPILM